jgi:MoxR-like ATPase
VNDIQVFPPTDDRQALHALARLNETLSERIHSRIVGQHDVVSALLVTLFAGGHAIFVGVPGLAKTLLVQSLAQALGLSYSRIQFTPDLMPSDVTGSDILDLDEATGRRSFRFVPGPVFCNLLLADEINRTPPKTQSALLQAMQEGRVTASGKTYELPQPFHVFATRNPIEQEGTYSLPEAQLDRFMMQIRVDYPDAQSEREIVTLSLNQREPIEPVLGPEDLAACQEFVRRIPVAPSIVDYIVRLIRASRPSEATCPDEARPWIRFGAGPRAGQQLLAAAQARAALRGSPAVEVQDVRALAVSVLEHRLVPSYAASADNIEGPQIVASLLRHVNA